MGDYRSSGKFDFCQGTTTAQPKNKANNKNKEQQTTNKKQNTLPQRTPIFLQQCFFSQTITMISKHFTYGLLIHEYVVRPDIWVWVSAPRFSLLCYAFRGLAISYRFQINPRWLLSFGRCSTAKKTPQKRRYHWTTDWVSLCNNTKQQINYLKGKMFL